MDTQDSKFSGAKKMPASRARAAAVAGIAVIASITGVTVSAQIYGLKGLNGQLEQVSEAKWLPIGLNATFSHAMLYRNSHLRTIAKHVIDKGQSATLIQYAQAQVRKLDDWDTRITALLKANNIDADFAENELNSSYQGIEDLAGQLSILQGEALDRTFKDQMIALAEQMHSKLESDISLLDDKQLEGVAAEIAGSNHSISEEINAG
jgi:hypothetical protein